MWRKCRRSTDSSTSARLFFCHSRGGSPSPPHRFSPVVIPPETPCPWGRVSSTAARTIVGLTALTAVTDAPYARAREGINDQSPGGGRAADGPHGLRVFGRCGEMTSWIRIP
jgi:hypothetical protein